MEQQITQFLTKLAITYRIVRHPAVFTVDESKKYLAEKTPVKCLLLKEKLGAKLALVIMHGDKRLNTNDLSNQLGWGKLEFAKLDVLQSKLGVAPGSVSLFCLLYPNSKNILVVVDEDLTSGDEIGFHPNDNTATLFIAGDAISNIIQSTGHEFQVKRM